MVRVGEKSRGHAEVGNRIGVKPVLHARRAADLKGAEQDREDDTSEQGRGNVALARNLELEEGGQHGQRRNEAQASYCQSACP